MDAQFVRLTIASGVLKDEKFLVTCLNENTPDRQVIYEDPKPGFCICAHVNRDAREVNPQDQGTSLPIYGQAFGETEMRDYFEVLSVVLTQTYHKCTVVAA